MSKLLDALPPPQRKPLRISTDIPLFVRYSSGPSSCSSQSSQSAHRNLFHVLCMHDFKSSDPVHLPFHKDEVLTIVKQELSGWWAAMRPEGNRIGWIPSSFVLPLDRSKIVDYPDETLWPNEDLNDPLSAAHDMWVPVSDGDYKDQVFQLPTPTDIVLYKGFFDARAGNHNEESLLDLSNHERSNDVGYVCVPLTSESPLLHETYGPHFPPCPLPSELGAPQRTQPPSPPLFDAEWYHHPHPYTVDTQISLLTTSDEFASEFVSGLSIEDSPIVSESLSGMAFLHRTPSCPT